VSKCQYQYWIPTSDFTYLLNYTIQANVMWIHRDLIPIKQHRKWFTSDASVSFTVPILGNAESELLCYDFVMSLDISTSINTTWIPLSSAVCIRLMAVTWPHYDVINFDTSLTTWRISLFSSRSMLVCIWWYIGDVSDWMGTWHAFVYFNALLKIIQTRLVVIVTYIYQTTFQTLNSAWYTLYNNNYYNDI